MAEFGPEVLAAGGVLHRLSGKGKRKVLLVHRKKYDDWTLPKGHMERGESLREAAEREVLEETGFEPRSTRQLGTVGYRVGRGRKMVRYWLMDVAGGKFIPNSEVDDIQWLSLPKARRVASYPIDGNVLDWTARVLRNPDASRIYLVRHGYAGQRSRWKGSDYARPLSNKGIAQARHLAVILTKVPLERLITSPWVRCVETVLPLAHHLQLKVETDDRFGEDVAARLGNDILADTAGQSVVLCGHGNGLEAVLDRARRKGAELDGPPGAEKGAAWVLDVDDGRVTSGTYLPPLRKKPATVA